MIEELTVSDGAEGDALGWRAARTRNAILDASRRLFLEQGYLGTKINNITDACGISRAGFYTYFKDKREVFDVLGQTAYRDLLEVVGLWDSIGRPCEPAEIRDWVRAYYGYLERHGALVHAAGQALPQDMDVKIGGRRMQMRIAFLIGVNIRSRQRTPTDAPEALGLSIMAMLERSWYLREVQRLPVTEEDMIQAGAALILAAMA